jgi:hypothetical protein
MTAPNAINLFSGKGFAVEAIVSSVQSIIVWS